MTRLAWIDLETTGLDPLNDRILEVACIVTDVEPRGGCSEVARYEAITDAARRVEFETLDPVVQVMHTTNLLWDASLVRGRSIGDIENELVEFLETHAPRAQLAGSTVSFDRSFLHSWMPRAARVLHYRNLDVTTLNEVARRWWPTVHANRPRPEKPAHRAMADLEASIETLEHYLWTMIDGSDFA